MDILLNELSLNGQFANTKEFTDSLTSKMLPALKSIRQASLCLMKKQTLYKSKVTKDYDLHTILIKRQIDSIRKVKSLLSNMFLSKPYWDTNPKHSNKYDYFYKNEQVNNTSLAEACERDKLTLSFEHKDFYDQFIKIKKNSEEITLNNIVDKNSLYFFLFENKLIEIDDFINNKFSGTKINFSKLKKNFGFDILEPSEIPIFINSFEEFSKMEWIDIRKNKGLRYKKFKNEKKFKEITYRIDKFRVTQKYRCFGYIEKEIFFVIGFETDHKLSDKG